MNNNNSNSNNPPPISRTTFFISSAGIFSLGMLFGVHRVMKKEKADVPALRHSAPPAFMAARALGWGTVLCLSAFTCTTVAFSLLTGIESTSQFATAARQKLVKWGISEELTPARQAALEQESMEMVKSIEEGWDELVNSFSDKLPSIMKGSDSSSSVNTVVPPPPIDTTTSASSTKIEQKETSVNKK
eukprot:gene3644-3989_t